MSYELAIKELSAYVNIMDEIQSLGELMLHLNTSNKIKALRYDTDKIKTSHNADLSDSIAKLESIKKMYTERLSKNLDLIKGIESKISQIDYPIYRTILMKKYIQGHKLEYVATVLRKSLSYIKILHRRAVISYGKI